MLARGEVRRLERRAFVDAEGVGSVRWPDVVVVVVLSGLAGWLAQVEHAAQAALVVVGVIGGYIARGPQREPRR